MAVCRAVPHWGASHGRAALLDRRFQPVRSKPDRLQGIWARPRLAASMQRPSRCGRDGPDSRSGRSGPRLTNPDRFAKNFPLARSEGVDQEPDVERDCGGLARDSPGFLRSNLPVVQAWREIGQNHRSRGSSCFACPLSAASVDSSLALRAPSKAISPSSSPSRCSRSSASSVPPSTTAAPSRRRSSMQAALDSTALMLSKDLTSGTDHDVADISTKAQSYFNGLFTDTEAQSRHRHRDLHGEHVDGSSTIQLTGDRQHHDQFHEDCGFPTLDFNTTSTSTWGIVQMRVALVLDITGSMAQDGKITALQKRGGRIRRPHRSAQRAEQEQRRRLYFGHSVRQGRQCRRQQLQQELDRLDRLADPPTTQPANGSLMATLPMNWHAVGPGAKCPFSTSSGGFTCNAGPTSKSNASTIPPTGNTYAGYICPSVDANSHTLYNGCWTSEAAGTGVFCSGSSSCACPKDSSNNAVSGCTCTGSNGGKSCTSNLYVHNWTQPGPNDLTHNPNQPRVNAVVGFTNNKWTSTNTTPTVVNAYNQASTNPISTWTGCVADRTQPNDATGVLPATSDVTTLFPANEYYENSTSYCSSSASTQLEPLIPLSYNWSTLKTAVNAMQPTGGTNQAVGLAWGWQSLLIGGPLNAPAKDRQHDLQQGHHPAVRRSQHRRPLARIRRRQLAASGNPIDVRQALLCNNLQAARDSKGQRCTPSTRSR